MRFFWLILRVLFSEPATQNRLALMKKNVAQGSLMAIVKNVLVNWICNFCCFGNISDVIFACHVTSSTSIATWRCVLPWYTGLCFWEVLDAAKCADVVLCVVGPHASLEDSWIFSTQNGAIPNCSARSLPLMTWDIRRWRWRPVEKNGELLSIPLIRYDLIWYGMIWYDMILKGCFLCK